MALKASDIPERRTLRQTLARWWPWLRKGGFAILDQGLFAGTNFVVSVLLVRWLSESAYGAYASAYALFLLISNFYNVFIFEPTTIFGASKYEDRLPAYVRMQLKIYLSGYVVMSLVLGLVVTILARLDLDSNLFAALVGMSISHGAMLIILFSRRVFYTKHRPAQAAIASLIYCVCAISCIVLLERYNLLSPFAAFAAMGLAAIVASAATLRSKPHINTQESLSLETISKENLVYGGCIAVAGVLAWLSTIDYVVITGQLLDLTESGALKAIQNLTLPITQAITALSLVFIPRLSQQFYRQGMRKLLKETLAFTTITTTAAVLYLLFLVIAGGPVFQLFYQGKFQEYQPYLAYLGFVPVIMALTSLWNVSLRIIQRTRYVFLIDSAGAIVTLTLGVALIQQYDVAGAVYGMLLSAGIRVPLLALAWWLASRKTERPAF